MTEVPLDRIDRGHDTRVFGGQHAGERHRQSRGIQHLVVQSLCEGTETLVEGAG